MGIFALICVFLERASIDHPQEEAEAGSGLLACVLINLLQVHGFLEALVVIMNGIRTTSQFVGLEEGIEFVELLIRTELESCVD